MAATHKVAKQATRYKYDYVDDGLRSMAHLDEVLNNGVVLIERVTPDSPIKRIVRDLPPGEYTTKEIYGIVEDSGVLSEDRGDFAPVQDGQAKWKRDVRNTIQSDKNNPASNLRQVSRAVFVVEGTRKRFETATLIAMGEPSGVRLVLKTAEEALKRLSGLNLVLADPPQQMNVGGSDKVYAGRRVYARDQQKVVPGYVDYKDGESYRQKTADWMGPAAEALAPGGYIAIITNPQRVGDIAAVADDLGLTFINQISSRRPMPIFTNSPRRLAFSHDEVRIVCKEPSKNRYFAAPDDLPLAASGVEYPQDLWLDIPTYERRGLLRNENSVHPLLVDRVMRMLLPPAEAVRPDRVRVAEPFLGLGPATVRSWLNDYDCVGSDANPDAIKTVAGRILYMAAFVESMFDFGNGPQYKENLVRRRPMLESDMRTLTL